MPVPVFDQTLNDKNEKDVTPKIKERTSGVAILFAVFLVLALIFTSELFLNDTNNNFNNEYSRCLIEDANSSIFKKNIVSADCNLQRYEGIRLLIHIDVLIPVIITGFIFIYIIRKKKLSSYLKVLRNAFIVSISWLSFRLLAETEYYLIKHEPLIGKYIILLTIILLLIYLVVLIQRRFIKKPI